MDILNRMVDFPSNGQTTPGYLAQPADSDEHPGLIVIQEWWGLVPHIKDLADRFARQGYIALAPDLYHGQAASEPDEARKLAMELDRERAVKEICAGIAFLQTQGRAQPKKIGLIGFCMGGSLAIASAAASQDVGAVIAFYGLPRDLAILQTLQAPLLGLFGEHDHGIPVESVQAFQAALSKLAIEHEVHVYPGAGHAFFNDARPHIYHPQAAENAWQRSLDWLARHLV